MERISLNDNWEFTRYFTPEFIDGDAGLTEKVRLPHTVRETPFNYFDESIYQMVSGYRRTLMIPEYWRDKRLFLQVGAAAHSAEVYLNGVKCGEHHCGYTAFTADLSTAARYGEDNLLVIRVDSRENQNIPPFGYVIDYMTYGGLYREVWLEVKEKTHLLDVFVRPEVPDGAPAEGTAGEAEGKQLPFTGTVRSEIRLAGKTLPDLQIVQMVRKNGKVLAERRIPWAEAKKLERKLPHGAEKRTVEVSLEAPGVRLWDTEDPQLYELHTELRVRSAAGEDMPAGEEPGETVLDERDDIFGFRRAEFKADGFYLNGSKRKIRGLNRHQSFPYVGYAAPASLQRQDAEILKYELGLNAVRTSHYPQSPHFIRRCDEIGLLVFTEIPGWQHIGDQDWQRQAVINTEDMVRQYRNHPSVILWGVRINESKDNDPLYRATNKAAHALDPTRQTSGVRYLKKSHLLEDVYAYNDFSHNGENAGCEKRSKVTPEKNCGYLISEYNGHMFPTKMSDDELHRTEHLIRHANVLDAAAGGENIAGSFGWCMADYNTHKDFGSGDRICYHGVLDMYRNPKPAAAVYAAQQVFEPVLEITSTMDNGEHPAGVPGKMYILTNADSVRMFKNDILIREYKPEDSAYRSLPHGPILIDDFVGDRLAEEEHFSRGQAEAVKYILNYAAVYGMEKLPAKVLQKGLKLIARYHMKYSDAYELYGKYIGNWGKESAVCRFEAVRDGRVVRTVTKEAVRSLKLAADVSSTLLTDGPTYDMAAVRLQMKDQNGNLVPFYHGCIHAAVSGGIELVGPEMIALRGGCGGCYVRTTLDGPAEGVLELTGEQTESVTVRFLIRK